MYVPFRSELTEGVLLYTLVCMYVCTLQEWTYWGRVIVHSLQHELVGPVPQSESGRECIVSNIHDHHLSVYLRDCTHSQLGGIAGSTARGKEMFISIHKHKNGSNLTPPTHTHLIATEVCALVCSLRWNRSWLINRTLLYAWRIFPIAHVTLFVNISTFLSFNKKDIKWVDRANVVFYKK